MGFYAMKMKGIKLLIAIGLLLAACTSSSLYDTNRAIPDAHWHKEMVPSFDVWIEDTTTIYRFFINVRNTDDYRYSNLYVFLQTHFPNGNITRDTIECILAAPDGRWQGRKSGKTIEHQILLNDALKFPLKGQYVFEIEQAMREPLKGVTDIGIRIDKGD